MFQDGSQLGQCFLHRWNSPWSRGDAWLIADACAVRQWVAATRTALVECCILGVCGAHLGPRSSNQLADQTGDFYSTWRLIRSLILLKISSARRSPPMARCITPASPWRCRGFRRVNGVGIAQRNKQPVYEEHPRDYPTPPGRVHSAHRPGNYFGTGRRRV